MTIADWQSFLREWNRDLLDAASLADDEELEYADVTENVLASGWLGYPGATAQEIDELEKRLGAALAPSYRTFLQVSNGFRQPRCFVPRIYSTWEVGWLKESHPQYIKAWISGETGGGPALTVPDSDYYVYGERQDPSDMRSEYLWHSLEISAEELAGTALYLLNSAVKFPNGEWEAWLWAHWLPGAQRYQSFWDLMQDERNAFLDLQAKQAR